MSLKKIARAVTALSACAALSSSLCLSSVSAAVIDTEHQNNYDNFAEALQLALCFYDANKCGDEVGEDDYYTWRDDCHVKDGQIPLQEMKSLDGGDKKAEEDSGKGDGGLSAQKGLYEGTNMSEEFIEANRQYLDPDGDGMLDLTGGWHDAGDHVKFGLPGAYSASTVGWGYYEFREDYAEMGLQKHVEDELRWINDYFLKATFLDDDGKVVGYCYQVGEGNNDHNYWCAPELQVDDTIVATSSCAVKRPAYFATTETPASDQCAGAAASLAINYLNFKDTDSDYAEKCLQYAKALYDFAVETHTEVDDREQGTPKATSLGYDGGFYPSSYDYDELAWAAVWLYYCTENYDYINDIIAVDESVTNGKGSHPYTGYMKRIISDTGQCWQNIWVHCWDTVWGGVFAKLAPVTNLSRDWYIFRYNLEFWSGCAATIDDSAFGYEPVHSHKLFGLDDTLWNTSIDPKEIIDLPDSKTSGDFIAKSPNGWAVVSEYGSARYNTAAGLCACVYAKSTGDETFLPWAKRQMEYILGDNPMGYAYEVGYEYSYASQPHHRAAHCSATQSQELPVGEEHILYGALVGGPDLKDYHHDETKDYIYNEVTDDYNAGFCGDLAGLYHYYGAKGKELEKQNYIIPDWDMSQPKEGGTCESHPEIFVTAAKNQETDAGLQVKVVIHNRTTNPPRFMDDLSCRYYFNIQELLDIGEDASFVECCVDYDAEDAMTSGKSHAVISEPVKYDDNGTYYVEIKWENCRFYGSRVFQFRLINTMNPETYTTTWDSSNDYSYEDLISFEDDNDAAVLTDKITVYVDGNLVGGVEPDGTAAESSSSKVLYGDVDCNGEVDILDVIHLNKNLMGKVTLSKQGELNADVNTNGKVESTDGMNILKAIVNLITLPVK